ncbi:hypothetical protein EYF80_027296 [Liparis tanakae]|uniref:Uncharacterized protein n=1 Tax=Liparis tanakae TaxID=230148 RepID=A0A4Z2HBV8_9TELE|nr:hypothetical protein EYF80_027296 [Liparis tanakae]
MATKKRSWRTQEAGAARALRGGCRWRLTLGSQRQRVAVLSSVRRGAGPDGEAGPCREDAATQNWVSSRGYVL